MVPLLGHVVVAGEGIKAYPGKVTAIVAMERPATSEMLKKFLGMTGYLQKFIPSYAEYTEPLRAIVKKYPEKHPANIEQEWDMMSTAAFESLKVAMANAALLYFPDYDKPFIIITNASNNTGALGAVLVQLDEDNNERPIAYASAALTKAQKNYGITSRTRRDWG